MSTSTSTAVKEVGLVVTSAPLLSGTLRDCAVPIIDIYSDETDGTEEEAVAADDDRCSSGGVAAVQAYVRYYNSIAADPTTMPTLDDGTELEQQQSPVLVVPMGDFKSPLTEMSRFHFGVNVMIYANELQWRTWSVPAYTLWPFRLDSETVADAQEPLFPAVVSNVATNPSEDWHPYVKSIHFDPETQMALMYITKEYLDNTVSQVESVQKLVRYVYKHNAANRCETPYASAVTSSHSAFQDSPFSEWWMEHNDDVLERISADRQRRQSTSGEASNHTWVSSIDWDSLPNQQHDPGNCFVPVVVFDDESNDQFQMFVDAFNRTNVTFAPQLIIDIYGQIVDEDGNPTIQTIRTENAVTPTWIVSYMATSETFDQIRVGLSSDRTSIENVSLIHDDLLDLPEQARTQAYYNDLKNIRQYAHEAWATSLVSEEGVKTLEMNEQTNPDDGYRHCYTGECEMGNLLADSLRWIEGADVALVPSFMFTGPGWKEGEIRTLEILENLPYTISRCSGTMTGHSLLRLINHSILTSTFGGFDSTQTGGRLLQVSGLKVVFNNIIEGQNRIISMDIWDEEADAFSPLNRTKLYRFTSCGHLCFTFVDYPPFLGEYLTEEGEVPAEQSSETDIKDDLKEYLYSQFLDTDSVLKPRIEGRLDNDITRFDVLPIVTREDCAEGSSFWSSESLDCESCPNYGGVVFSKSNVELHGNAFSKDQLKDRVTIINQEAFPVELIADTVALPENIGISLVSECDFNYSNVTDVASCILGPNQQFTAEIYFDPSGRDAGRDTSSLLFTLSDMGRSQGCPVFKGKYAIVANLSLSRDSNLLGGVAAFGYTCAAITILTAIGFASWVRVRRRTRLVSTMQPVFLLTLCVGVLLLGAGLIPYSIDDGVASQQGCNLSCIFRPWLLSVGFMLCVTALFSKLWRINKLFRLRQFRRIEIREKDVILPTSILFVMNIVFNLVWTVVDPLQWERVTVEGQPWNTYGRCYRGDGRVGTAMLACISAVCAVGFIMTCLQAFRARDISSEFSESKYLGIAIFSWVQICVVGVPVLFLVDEENVVARYSLVVGFVFTICMSMLLVVFVPMMLFKQRRRESNTSSLKFLNSKQQFSNGISSGNGLPLVNNEAIPSEDVESKDLQLNGSAEITVPHHNQKTNHEDCTAKHQNELPEDPEQATIRTYHKDGPTNDVAVVTASLEIRGNPSGLNCKMHSAETKHDPEDNNENEYSA
jgi:7 transmembrane sweet-taste receptor of 3 GCPR/5'-nucleotidase, C-terminal domain